MGGFCWFNPPKLLHFFGAEVSNSASRSAKGHAGDAPIRSELRCSVHTLDSVSMGLVQGKNDRKTPMFNGKTPMFNGKTPMFNGKTHGFPVSMFTSTNLKPIHSYR